jgi:hypothetical protein
VNRVVEAINAAVAVLADRRDGFVSAASSRTLYRAAHDATVTSGTCFAQDIDDAIEYQDNPGFGGPNLYSLEVTPTYKTFVKDLGDARDQIADAIMKHGWPSGVRRPRELDHDEVDLTKEDLVAWLEDVFSGYESGHAHVHDVVADTPWVVDLLGQSYDWVVFKDSFPEDCITWCYVGDDDLEDGMSLVDAQARISAIHDALDPSPSLRRTSVMYHVAPAARTQSIASSGLKSKEGRVYLWDTLAMAEWYKELQEEDGKPMTIWKVDASDLLLEEDQEADDMSEWSSKFSEGTNGGAFFYEGVIPSSKLRPHKRS